MENTQRRRATGTMMTLNYTQQHSSPLNRVEKLLSDAFRVHNV